MSLFRMQDIQSMNEQASDQILTEIEQAIVDNRLYEYVIESVYGADNLTVEDIISMKHEIMNETASVIDIESAKKQVESAKQQFSGDITSEEEAANARKNVIAMEKIQREAEQYYERAEAEKKGIFAVIINMLKRAISWLKRKILAAKDFIYDKITGKPKNYSAAKRAEENLNKA